MFKNLTQKKQLLFSTPEEFLAACVEYFEWCIENPLLEDLVFMYKGAVVRTTKSHPRPFTKQGLATFIGVPVSRLSTYRQRLDNPAWEEAVEMIEQVMHEQKFSGAVAGMMNAAMIKSDLGLVDRSELTGRNGGPIRTQDISVEEEKLYDEARRLGIDVAAFGFSGRATET